MDKRDIAWIKPVQHKVPVSEMSDALLRIKLLEWQRKERIAHSAVDNNKGSGLLIAFEGNWTKCKRLIKEIEDEMKRRDIFGEELSRNDDC